ncbi:MAG: hypothetical protein MI919_14000, partial [Holophagales bacterium]|nr:hypothetical protein [Holophagales bacterium]
MMPSFDPPRPAGSGPWLALAVLFVPILAACAPPAVLAEAQVASRPGPSAVPEGLAPDAGPAAEEGLREELRRLVGHARDQVFPALVSIRVVTVQYSGGKELKGQVVGSGTVV